MSSPSETGWKEYLRLGLDYGTGELKIAAQYIHDGVTEATPPVEDVPMLGENRDRRIKQIGVSLDLDSTDIRWGDRSVNRWLGQNPEGAAKVISAWKMALSPRFRNREVVRRTIDVLVPDIHKSNENITRAVQNWIATHLREIKAKVLEWYKTKSMRNHSRQIDWDDLPWEIQIAVPVSWNADAANVMSSAAIQAGFARSNIREEPQCVAAACMLQLKADNLVKVRAQSQLTT